VSAWNSRTRRRDWWPARGWHLDKPLTVEAGTVGRTAETHATATVRSKPATPRYRVARDPRRDSAIEALAAAALSEARPSLKALAAGGAVSKSRASRWCTEGKGSPVHGFFSLLDALCLNSSASAGALVAYAHSLLAESLMPISTEDLVARFWTLMREETRAEARENEHQVGDRIDLAALAAATLAEAGVQHEMAATCRELIRRGIPVMEYR
jgi:hypothetical protein